MAVTARRDLAMKIYENGASLRSVAYAVRWIRNTQQIGPDGTSIHDRCGCALRVHGIGNDLAWRTVGSPTSGGGLRSSSHLLIAQDSDFDDAIEAEKLAQLARGDFVKAARQARARV